MQQMQVTVPKGIGPGMPFQVNTPTGPMQVVCPDGAFAGGQMMVNVPMAPAPLVMATPVGMGASPTMMAALTTILPIMAPLGNAVLVTPLLCVCVSS